MWIEKPQHFLIRSSTHNNPNSIIKEMPEFHAPAIHIISSMRNNPNMHRKRKPPHAILINPIFTNIGNR
jgi:hypothetical protein